MTIKMIILNLNFPVLNMVVRIANKDLQLMIL